MRAATLLIIRIALCLPAVLAPAAVAQVFSNPTEITIPTSQGPATATPYPSTITVSGLTRPVSRVAVTLSGLSHTYPDDLSILLVAPDGTPFILMAAAGTNLDAVGLNLTFATDATSTLPDSGELQSGTYLPSVYSTSALAPPSPAPPYVASLGSLVGSVPNGAWRLYVFDRFSILDGGSIAGGWSMSFSSPPVLTPNPTGFTYQGRLTGAGGAPVNGPANARFSLWTTPAPSAAGNRIAGPTPPIPVTVNNGLFSTLVDLGPAARFPAALWLQVEVESPPGSGFTTLAPLQPLTPAPVATRALTADEAGRAATADFADLAANATNASSAAAAEKLEPMEDQFLRDFGLYLRAGPDTNHGLRYGGATGFGGSGPFDGPVLFGFGRGALGTTSGGERVALAWNSTGQVGIGTFSPTAALHVVGTVQADSLRFPDGTVQSSAFPGRIKTTVAANFGAIASNVTAFLTFAVTGAAVGDVVSISPRDPFPGSLIIGQARVTAANSVFFTVHNPTAASVDPPSTTFDVVVIK